MSEDGGLRCVCDRPGSPAVPLPEEPLEASRVPSADSAMSHARSGVGWLSTLCDLPISAAGKDMAVTAGPHMWGQLDGDAVWRPQDGRVQDPQTPAVSEAVSARGA